MQIREVREINESVVEMREIVMPNHINPQNIVFGGVIISWIDLAAAMCAMKHARANVVTVHIDDVSFLNSIRIGDHVIIKASLNYVGKTSMVIGVKVESENPYTGIRQKTAKAYLTFVSLDEFGKKLIVPSISPKSNDEIRRYENAKQRVNYRQELIRNLASS